MSSGQERWSISQISSISTTFPGRSLRETSNDCRCFDFNAFKVLHRKHCICNICLLDTEESIRVPRYLQTGKGLDSFRAFSAKFKIFTVKKVSSHHAVIEQHFRQFLSLSVQYFASVLRDCLATWESFEANRIFTLRRCPYNTYWDCKLWEIWATSTPFDRSVGLTLVELHLDPLPVDSCNWLDVGQSGQGKIVPDRKFSIWKHCFIETIHIWKIWASHIYDLPCRKYDEMTLKKTDLHWASDKLLHWASDNKAIPDLANQEIEKNRVPSPIPTRQRDPRRTCH